ncbi:MAG: aminodeoxychorismate synthase component I [Gammaproteobacteria bacterium]|nr:aminodeoxychorismate synthase component I [Gammaproteobacteria bacterium]
MTLAYFQSFPLQSIPDLLSLHAQNPERYPQLLATTAGALDHPGYDILFACPQQSLVVNQPDSFLELLDETWQGLKQGAQAADLPFYGGWFLYLGYELAAEIEPELELPPSDDGLPVAVAVRIPAAIIVDKQLQQAFLVCENDYLHCRDEIESDLARPVDNSRYQQSVAVESLVEDAEQAYLDQVLRIKDYIVEGDIFQANLSRGWLATLNQPCNHASLFWHLSQTNPGPFNALVNLGDQAIVSSSPERLVSVDKGVIQTRPIAGTRPRSADNQQDQALSIELLGHPKERAEHIMLIDLERNDLGRLCVSGSVEVNELMVLESYQHVHHIVSNVRGQLRPNISPGAVIRAVFPGGTITGCPKIRCMEILAELEQVGRGAYTGSLGYLNRDGNMDLNILIRTLVRDRNQIRFRAGGGIVADSDPHNELMETRAKAKGLVMALMGDS